MVTCIKCGKNLIKECACFQDDLERIKEWGRLGKKELDVIINVIENNKPLFIRLVNDKSLTILASIERTRNGIVAKANFALREEGVMKFKREELLDWNKELIYFRPSDIELKKTRELSQQMQLKWNLQIG